MIFKSQHSVTTVYWSKIHVQVSLFF